MIEIIRPVRYGLLIGLLALVFGIGWAFWLVLGHEKIHETLERSAAEEREGYNLIQLLEPDHAYAHIHKEPQQKETVPGNENDIGHHHMEDEGHQKVIMEHHPDKEDESKAHIDTGHDSPVMELSHRRLTRGHIHAMGLGLLTILVSLVLAFTTALEKIKTIASVLTGLGGIIYPFAWILMGYRTPALGPDGAEASVTAIAGIGVALVLLGIFSTIAFLLRDIFNKVDTEQRI